jgi:hypothetical protein
MVLEWDTDGPGASASLKRGVLISVAGKGLCASQLVEATWGPICAELFNEFRDWIFDRRHEKEDLLSQSSKAVNARSLSPPLSKRNEHYSAVLKMFDDAIEATVPSSSRPAFAPASTCSTGGDQSSYSHPRTGNQDILSPPSADTISCNGFTELSRKRCAEEAEPPEVPRTRSRCIGRYSEPETIAVGR